MIYRFQLFAFILVCFSSSLVMASELDDAILYGELLTEAVKAKAEVKLKTLPEFEGIDQFLSENKCSNFKYKGYIVGPKDQQYFYLVASKVRNVIIGRHFKAPIKAGSIQVSQFESSTNSCLNLGTPASNVVALYATHFKPYPNEFHVLESNLRSIPLYVGTETGIYAVENGTIRLVEKE